MDSNGKKYQESDLKKDLDFISTEVNNMRIDIKDVDIEVKSVKKILMGTTTDTPDGIVYLTSRNTDFRKNATKVLWFLFTLITALIINEIFDFYSP